jgi:hypothetical protein
LSPCEDVRVPEYDGAYNTQEFLRGFPLKIPYIIYADRCDPNLGRYELRYADLFPNFNSWKLNLPFYAHYMV